MEFKTERFILRSLQLSDVTPTYLSWFEDPVTKKFIEYKKTQKLEELKEYVAQRINRDDILFLGIFSKENGQHIGNVKFEPINYSKSYCVMGILIGDVSYRSKGVAVEILEILKEHFRDLGLKKMICGVSKENIPAIKAYEKLGFKIVSMGLLGDESYRINNHEMELQL